VGYGAGSNDGNGGEEAPQPAAEACNNGGNGGEDAPEPAAGDSDDGGNGSEETPQPAAGACSNGGNGSEEAPEPAAGVSNNRGNGSEEAPEAAAEACNNGGGAGAAGSAGPGELLGEVQAIRRKARLARHAYWFPLVLFGLLTCGSVPFYVLPMSSGVRTGPLGQPVFQSPYLGGFGIRSEEGTAYYWLGAMLLGIAATSFWYRWRGNRVGLRTPARGYLITGLIIVALALLLPLAALRGAGMLIIIMPGDLLARGTFPFVLIGLGLCFLAWAERSVGLTVIAVVYLAMALLASLYDIENIFYNWFGWYLTTTENALPNVLLPALVLLLSGAGAWVVQRRQRAPVLEN